MTRLPKVLLFAGYALGASGFSIQSQRLPRKTFSAVPLKSTTADDGDKNFSLPTNPSTAFGSSISPRVSSLNRAAISFIKNSFFDKLFDTSTSNDRDHILSRSYARFYALETIARMPYFSYLSVLHLYETLGWWRRADYLKVHFCESWNELHHLLIMEELGGNERFLDRFIAQHAAFFYYWFVVFCYVSNPAFAYNLNEAVEEHAVETYSQFLVDFEVELKSKEPCKIAKEYYLGENSEMFLFDEMHICAENKSLGNEDDLVVDKESGVMKRRPKIDNLYDVFLAIRRDELEHVKTMRYLQEEYGDIAICNVD